MRLLKFVAQVDDFDAGERAIGDAGRQGEQFIFSVARVMAGFHGRRG